MFFKNVCFSNLKRNRLKTNLFRISAENHSRNERTKSVIYKIFRPPVKKILSFLTNKNFSLKIQLPKKTSQQNARNFL